MEFTELAKVILVGILEGITEWLPISSTGHMLLMDAFWPLHMTPAFKELFFVVIQLGAILAVVVLFWEQLWPLEKGKLHQETLTLWGRVLVGCVPAGVLGLLLDDFLEARFGTPLTIAAMLILYGIAFLVIERRPRQTLIHNTYQLPLHTAFTIGCFQALAMIPGTSRSGATILGALLLGVARVPAGEFSFFLAIPTMLGASALKLVKFGAAFTAPELVTLLLGMVVAFVVSIAAIRFLLDYVRTHDFRVFGWYRIGLGVLVIVLTLLDIPAGKVV